MLGGAPPSPIAQGSNLSRNFIEKLGVKPILGNDPSRGIAQKRSCHKIYRKLYVKFQKGPRDL